jgi:hypothetical protein
MEPETHDEFIQGLETMIERQTVATEKMAVSLAATEGLVKILALSSDEKASLIESLKGNVAEKQSLIDDLLAEKRGEPR